jgi:PAS domain S-box-containing protein
MISVEKSDACPARGSGESGGRASVRLPRVPRTWHTPLAAYLLAILLPAAMLAFRLSIATRVGQMPLLSLFIIPIIISAYLGGIGPGLLATLATALEVDYFLLPRPHSFLLNGLHAQLDLGALVTSGVLVSVLCEALHRSRRAAESSRRLQAVTLASIGDAVITTDLAGRVTFINGEAERLTGWPSAEGVGQPLAAVFPIVNAETRQAATSPVEEVLRSGAVAGLANGSILVSRQGKETPIDDGGAPIKGEDGKMLGVVLVFRDCSARKKAEQALREQLQLKERLAQIVDVVPGLIHAYRLNPDGTTQFTCASRQIKNFYETPLEELTRDARWARERVHPDDLPGMIAAVEESARNLTPFHHEFRLCSPKHGEFWVEIQSIPKKLPDGSVEWYGIMLNVTERKRAEAQLEEAHSQLVKASRLAGMAEMATGVLHNVGNVLNSVNVSAQVVADAVRQSRSANLSKVVALLREHDSDLATFLANDPKGQKIIPYLGELSQHLGAERAKLLEELGELARNVEHIRGIVSVQQGCSQTGGQRDFVDLADLLEQSLKLYANSLARGGVEVVRDFAKVPPVLTDRHKVLQILVNLARNAKQACDESGRADKRMTIRLDRDRDAVRITIEDNGVGIAKENMEKIFQHGFTTRKNGHGFGLHSSLLAAGELGGTVHAFSDGPGCGARFVLEIPIPPARADAPA